MCFVLALALGCDPHETEETIMRQHNHWKLDKLQRHTAKIVLWENGLLLLVLNTVFNQSIDYVIHKHFARETIRFAQG